MGKTLVDSPFVVACSITSTLVRRFHRFLIFLKHWTIEAASMNTPVDTQFVARIMTIVLAWLGCHCDSFLNTDMLSTTSVINKLLLISTRLLYQFLNGLTMHMYAVNKAWIMLKSPSLTKVGLSCK